TRSSAIVVRISTSSSTIRTVFGSAAMLRVSPCARYRNFATGGHVAFPAPCGPDGDRSARSRARETVHSYECSDRVRRCIPVQPFKPDERPLHALLRLPGDGSKRL